MKKLISILLSVMLVVSGLSLSTFATATEAYRFDFDEGFIAKKGGSSNGVDVGCITDVEGLELFTDATSIYLKGWCYTVSGVNELWYSVGNAGTWTQMPETGFSDRTDVYAAITQEMVNLGIPAETNKKTGFDYQIPLEGISLEIGMQAYKVKVVTNDGNEILLADVEFNYCEPYISTTPKDASVRGNNIVNVDWNATYRDGSETAKTSSTALQYFVNSADAVGSRGWVSIDVEIEAFGYSYNDDANIVYDAAFASTPEDAVKNEKYDYEMRYEIKVPTADFEIGTHTVKLYCKLVNGEQVIINELTVVVANRGEVIPNNVQGSVADFMAQSAWTLEESAAFVEGANLLADSVNYPGSTFRSEWSPRVLVNGSVTVKTDAAASNNYVQFDDYTAYFSDRRWQGGYTFYADLAINTVNRHGRGMFLNFSNEKTAIDNQNLTTVKLYEAWCDAPGNTVVTGDTGILIWPYDATTLKVAVLTYDLATDTKGAIVADFNLADAGIDFTTLTSVTAVDNGEGAIFVLVEDAVVAKITYSDDGLYAEGAYAERYYKTAQIIGADGTVLAETDKAIISYYKTAGIGTRANRLYVDNVSLAEAIEVTDPTAAPTEVVFTADSNYYMYKDTDIIVAVTSGTGYTKFSKFAENIANDATTYKVYDNAGVVATETTNMKTGYKLELYNANGELIKTYEIALLGDVDANGRANLSDYGKVKKSVTARTSATDFTGVYLAAADVTLYTRNQATYRVNLTDYGDMKAFVKSLGKWILA